jgi:hypothetical protein
MELLKQGKWLCMLLVISQSVFAQNTCPTIFHRNNGNGQSGDCPGVPGSSVPEATSVTGTNYSWSNLGLSVNAKEGDIGFQFPTALAPSLEPAIKTIWIGNTIVTDRKVGPPAPYDIVSSNKRFTYCFYNNNLPNVGSLTIEFVNPQTNTTYAVCSYDGSSSLTPPSISTNPSSEAMLVFQLLQPQIVERFLINGVKTEPIFQELPMLLILFRQPRPAMREIMM